MRRSLERSISSKFLTLGRKGIQVGAVVTVREMTGGLPTGAVLAEMTVVMIVETQDGMTVVTQDNQTGAVAVTVILEEMSEALTMTSPSKF
jgi:hypothetical protein